MFRESASGAWRRARRREPRLRLPGFRGGLIEWDEDHVAEKNCATGGGVSRRAGVRQRAIAKRAGGFAVE